MTPHIEARKEDIAKVVIMPGDPLRAKMIAEQYLKEYKLVNTVRNMFAYTGYYNDRLVTVFASGMGIPSIGIYAYELYKFYNVEKIIRVGTCGTYRNDIKMLDIILAESACSDSNFAESFNGNKDKEIKASKELNDKIEKNAQKEQIEIHRGKIITSDVFYIGYDEYIKQHPDYLDYLASEMEGFALFFLAREFNKQAACLLTVVDSHETNEINKGISSNDRQKSLNTMIELALNSL